jgi:hypothetical protein
VSAPGALASVCAAPRDRVGRLDLGRAGPCAFDDSNPTIDDYTIGPRQQRVRLSRSGPLTRKEAPPQTSFVVRHMRRRAERALILDTNEQSVHPLHAQMTIHDDHAKHPIITKASSSTARTQQGERPPHESSGAPRRRDTRRRSTRPQPPTMQQVNSNHP